MVEEEVVVAKIKAKGAEDVVYPIVYLTHEGPAYDFCRIRFIDMKPVYLTLGHLGKEPEVMVMKLKKAFLVKLCHPRSRSGKHSYLAYDVEEGYLYRLEDEYYFPYRGIRLSDEDIQKLKYELSPLVAWAVAEGYEAVWSLSRAGEPEAPRFWGVEEALSASKSVQGRLFATRIQLDVEGEMPWRYDFETKICGHAIRTPTMHAKFKVMPRTFIIKSDDKLLIEHEEHGIAELPSGCYLFHHIRPID